MKTSSKFIHSILKKFTFVFSILLFLFGINLSNAKAASGQSTEMTVRVAVRVKGPLNQATLNKLAQYGVVNHSMPGIQLVDLQLASERYLSLLQAQPWVQYVERDRVQKNVHQSAPGSQLPPDFTVTGTNFWNLDIINVTDFNGSNLEQNIRTVEE